jgi:hypothetical protein
VTPRRPGSIADGRPHPTLNDPGLVCGDTGVGRPAEWRRCDPQGQDRRCEVRAGPSARPRGGDATSRKRPRTSVQGMEKADKHIRLLTPANLLPFERYFSRGNFLRKSRHQAVDRRRSRTSSRSSSGGRVLSGIASPGACLSYGRLGRKIDRERGSMGRRSPGCPILTWTLVTYSSYHKSKYSIL